ncbi:MAG TPA: glycosyltransferase family 4 protein, partial [Planctomycetota bacterium]|nr:glycosyltransferase family 4 protein [Planctomycetota bacterium]
MKVCLVAGAFPPERCRTGEHTDCLARHLAELGVDVHVVTAGPSAAGRGFSVHRVAFGWGVGRAACAAVRAIAPDVVHVQYPAARWRRRGVLAHLAILLRMPNCKTVLTLHGYASAGLIGRLRQLSLAAAASSVIATNTNDFHRLCRAAFWKKDHIHCIPAASSVAPPGSVFDRQSRRRMFGADSRSFVICFLGSLHPGKGIENLIDAFGIVCRSKLNARLVIIGSTIPSQTLFGALLRRRIIDAGLADKVFISGFVPSGEISEWLLASDVCVLPSRTAATRGELLLTALRHGLPVITAAPIALPPGLIAEENMVLVSAGEAGKIAESI